MLKILKIPRCSLRSLAYCFETPQNNWRNVIVIGLVYGFTRDHTSNSDSATQQIFVWRLAERVKFRESIILRKDGFSKIHIFIAVLLNKNSYFFGYSQKKIKSSQQRHFLTLWGPSLTEPKFSYLVFSQFRLNLVGNTRQIWPYFFFTHKLVLINIHMKPLKNIH